MCDTIVALGNVTADGVTLFGKNSDREPNEAHHLLRIPAARHSIDDQVKCTYIEIPQVEQTYEVLLCKPFWIWGAEMGANEHGVTIGNEAVFTKIPYAKDPGLIGMDFLRLALERARTARQALDVITSLLAEYGQSGNCCFTHTMYYHNSFIIADPHEAWVLETAGKHWAAEQVKDIRTISNGITIQNQWDLQSPDLVSYAIDRGWCKSRDDFSFARCYSDMINTKFSRCNERQCRTIDALAAQHGKITIETMMRALRDHESSDASWSPSKGITTFSVCAHAGFGPIRGSQTTGSLVSHLAPDVQTHFVTATSAPCTSIFKPVWLGSDLPDTGPIPTDEYNSATLYWRHEALHRATLRDYAAHIALYRDERDALESCFVADALKCDSSQHTQFSKQCFEQADQAEARWLDKVSSNRTYPGFLYGSAWNGFDRAAGINRKV
ncbi:MAG: C69 family dipeptidase [Chloroflexi bacterium]|nr:C69 family dipeptidase [Chloroflexota bacterium]